MDRPLARTVRRASMMGPVPTRRDRPAERRPRRQAWVACMGMLLGLAVFVVVEHSVAPRYSFVTAADQAIPFLPLTWGLYVLFFPFIVAVCAYAQEHAFELFTYAVVMAFIVSMGCFLLFPETLPRPDPTTIPDAFLRQRITRFWAIDPPSNGLPSLHVSITCLACRMAWLTRYRWLTGATGLLICLSTLTVKQHTLVDVVGGVLLAGLCAMLADRWQRAEAPHGRA